MQQLCTKMADCGLPLSATSNLRRMEIGARVLYKKNRYVSYKACIGSVAAGTT